jgi:hypothetical protein
MYTYIVDLAAKGTEMLKIVGYLPLVSKDRKTMVQIFQDSDTGLIESVQVAQRSEAFDSWGSPTEVFKVD